MTTEVENKILGFISEKNIIDEMQYFPAHGTFSVEGEYDLVKDSASDDKIYVRSTLLTYHDYSLINRQYKIYSFNANTGEFLGEDNSDVRTINQMILIKPLL